MYMYLPVYVHVYRADKKIRHCRFTEEGGQFTIGSATFDTMTELISYYEQNPLYRRMKLKYAINEDILRQIGQVHVFKYSLLVHVHGHPFLHKHNYDLFYYLYNYIMD